VTGFTPNLFKFYMLICAHLRSQLLETERTISATAAFCGPSRPTCAGTFKQSQYGALSAVHPAAADGVRAAPTKDEVAIQTSADRSTCDFRARDVFCYVLPVSSFFNGSPLGLLERLSDTRPPPT